MTETAETPVHPGKSLKRALEQLERPLAEVARLLGLSRQTLYELFGEKQCLTPQVALRIAKLTATSAKEWLDLQQAYDLHEARVEDADLLVRVPVLGERW